MSEIGNNGNDRVLLNAGNVSWLKHLLSAKGVLARRGEFLGAREMQKRLIDLCKNFPDRPREFQGVQMIIGWLHRTENGDPLTQVNSADRKVWEWFTGNLLKQTDCSGYGEKGFRIELQAVDKRKLSALMSQKKISNDDLIRRDDCSSCQKPGAERAKLTKVLTGGCKFIDADFLKTVLERLLDAENEPGWNRLGLDSDPSAAALWARDIVQAIEIADLHSGQKSPEVTVKTAEKNPPAAAVPVAQEFKDSTLPVLKEKKKTAPPPAREPVPVKIVVDNPVNLEEVPKKIDLEPQKIILAKGIRGYLRELGDKLYRENGREWGLRSTLDYLSENQKWFDRSYVEDVMQALMAFEQEREINMSIPDLKKVQASIKQELWGARSAAPTTRKIFGGPPSSPSTPQVG